MNRLLYFSVMLITSCALNAQTASRWQTGMTGGLGWMNSDLHLTRPMPNAGFEMNYAINKVHSIGLKLSTGQFAASQDWLYRPRLKGSIDQENIWPENVPYGQNARLAVQAQSISLNYLLNMTPAWLEKYHMNIKLGVGIGLFPVRSTLSYVDLVDSLAQQGGPAVANPDFQKRISKVRISNELVFPWSFEIERTFQSRWYIGLSMIFYDYLSDDIDLLHPEDNNGWRIPDRLFSASLRVGFLLNRKKEAIKK